MGKHSGNASLEKGSMTLKSRPLGGFFSFFSFFFLVGIFNIASSLKTFQARTANMHGLGKKETKGSAAKWGVESFVALVHHWCFKPSCIEKGAPQTTGAFVRKVEVTLNTKIKRGKIMGVNNLKSDVESARTAVFLLSRFCGSHRPANIQSLLAKRKRGKSREPL